MVSVMLRQSPVDLPVQVYQRVIGQDKPVTINVAGIRPPLPNPDPIGNLLENRPFYVAHRLGGADYPEFTMSGLQFSLGSGYKAVEFSVYITSDNVFVGSHDWTTERTTGVRHEIWDTPWSVISGLMQQGGPMIRLEDLVGALPDDVVVFLDHKGTSSRETPSQDGLRSETLLFQQLETLFPDPTKRVIWKCFAEASSAERARARGYKVNCMLYPDTMVGADFTRWDVLGMEWNASQEVWNQLKATGKPTIAHIIYTKGQAQTGLSKGADGLMSSAPSLVGP